jgi:hypothetical protein
MRFDLGNCAASVLGDLHPKMANLWLGLCVGCPVVPAVFVFAGQLAAVTSVAFGHIDQKYF